MATLEVFLTNDQSVFSQNNVVISYRFDKKPTVFNHAKYFHDSHSFLNTPHQFTTTTTNPLMM